MNTDARERLLALVEEDPTLGSLQQKLEEGLGGPLSRFANSLDCEVATECTRAAPDGCPRNVTCSNGYGGIARELGLAHPIFCAGALRIFGPVRLRKVSLRRHTI